MKCIFYFLKTKIMNDKILHHWVIFRVSLRIINFLRCYCLKLQKACLFVLFLCLGISNLTGQSNCGAHCYSFSGNLDYKAIGSTMSYSEARDNCNKKTSSSANLSIPSGSTIKKAYLQWSGSGNIDNSVTLNGYNISAHKTYSFYLPNGGWSGYYYGAYADVTSIVKNNGSYTLSNLNWSNASHYCQPNSAYGAWSLVVVYENTNLDYCKIMLCQDNFRMTFPSGDYSSQIGCIDPSSCTSEAELTIIAFEGDNYKGEHLYIGGQYYGDNNFKGQSGPNLDILTFNVSNLVNASTSSLSYSIKSYYTNTIWGGATEGLFDFVKILKYNVCSPNPCDNKGGDSDGDGICNNDDCAPFDANFPKPVGTACNDNNPNTVNDKIQGDGCSCQGTVVEPVCDNITFGGKIGFGTACSGSVKLCVNSDNKPLIENCQPPTGGSGAIEYIWLKNEVSCDGPTGTVAQMLANSSAYNWKVIFNSNSPTFNPGTLTTSTCFLRCARRVGCDLYLGESNIVRIDVNDCGGGTTPPPTGNCTDVTTTGEAGKVSINNIPSSAKVEIAGPSTGWGLQLVCNGNCNGTEMVSNLSEGVYSVKIQTFDPYCYTQIDVTVTAEGGSSNPCDSQDSDGDGICDNNDNCRYNANADQADNDNDGIGNVCDDTPNGGGTTPPPSGSCTDVTATGEAGKVSINNIPSSAKVEISGPSTSWGLQLVCNGNCNGTEMVNNLSEGVYSVKIQTFNPYCYAQIDVTVTAEGGSSNLCDSQGGDSDGDGICDNNDNCRYNANADQADNDNDGIGNVCDDTPNGGGTTPPPSGSCTDVTATGEAGKVSINNIPSSAKVEISGPSTDWGLQLVCNGNCNGTEMVSNLSEGVYSVKIQTFDPYCYAQIDVTVTAEGGSNNPCDSQGSDSDGDGICDNNDNCRYNANADQADNDNDGIGNVCDDTPNGGGNGGDCNSVTVSGSDGKVTINNIPTGAKVEISGPSTGWGQQVVCSANCSSMEMVSNLSSGEYTVTVQTFNPYCYKRTTVTVSGGNPCDSQGSDSDGDGICDNDDCAPFDANFPKPVGVACNDNNPNTVDDKVQSDGCSCQGTFDACANYGDAQKVYQVLNANPVCDRFDGYGSGIIFQANYDEPYKVWKAGADLVYIQYANGTAKMKGTLIKDGITADLDIDFFDFVAYGTSDWEHSCYISNLGDYSNYHYSGTLKTPSTTYSMHNLHQDAYINVGYGTSNDGNQLGIGGWPRGSIGDQAEMFGNFQLICSPSGSRNTPQLDFSAFKAAREVELQWVTNTGYKNAYYEIEKSVDGTTFETLQRVENEDFSDDMEFYNGIDPVPALGENYYRIKQVYTDGTFDYTDIQTINYTIDLSDFSMYPNPATAELNFNLKPFVGKKATITILNNFGQVVKLQEIEEVVANQINISLNNLTNGFYQVMIQVKGQPIINRKLVVERLY